MFGDIKKILGIEDVKIMVTVPEKIIRKQGSVRGTVKLTSMNNSEINRINIKMIEKYHRGRGDSKLTDEYTIGEINMEENIYVKKNDILEIPFELPFVIVESEIDKIESRNFFLGGFASLAKSIKGVKSEFRIEATAYVKGTRLHPHHSLPIRIK